MTDIYFGYECLGNGEISKCVGETGLVLDLRLPARAVELLEGSGVQALRVLCPNCNEPMLFKSRWTADEDGYGSRADQARRKS